MSLQEIEALRPPVIVQSFLRHGEVLLLGAESKSRKSWLAQDLALCVAAGLPWLPGDDTEGFATKQSNVFVFDLELAETEIAFRFAKARNNAFPDPQAQAAITQRFNSFSLEGIDPLTIRRLMTELQGMVAPGDLVVVDCFYRLQADGNETQLVAYAFDGLKLFAKQTQAGVILIDHFRKASADKARDRFAGSFVKQAGPSTLVAIETDKTGNLTLNVDARTFHDVKQTVARFDLQTYRFLTVDPAYAAQAKADLNQADAVAELQQVFHSAGCRVTRKGAADKWGLSDPGAGGRMRKHEARGWVESTKSPGKSSIYSLTPAGKLALGYA